LSAVHIASLVDAGNDKLPGGAGLDNLEGNAGVIPFRLATTLT
jgi:hypothetical protein